MRGGQKRFAKGGSFLLAGQKQIFKVGIFLRCWQKIPRLGIQRGGASLASRSRVGQEVFGVQGRSLGEC